MVDKPWALAYTPGLEVTVTTVTRVVDAAWAARKGFIALTYLAAMSLALAQPADPLADLTDFICAIVATLSGAFGIALSLAVLAVGLLLLALGARGAMSRIGIGVVAIAGLVSLPTLFTSMFPAAAGSICPVL